MFLKTWALERIFSREGLTVDFPGVAKNIFLGGENKLEKFNFNHSKLRK